MMITKNFFCCFCVFSYLIQLVQSNIQYAVVIDAGSTGSRSYILKISSLGDTSVSITPGLKVKPGLSSFHENLGDLESYLHDSILHAISVVPNEYIGITELHVRGTGGMRLLHEDEQVLIWDALFSHLLRWNYPFVLRRDNFGTISGEKNYDSALTFTICSSLTYL